jgi:hypothetical protein
MELKKIISVFALLLYIFGLFVLGEQYRNWSQHADQEFTLAYNALLSNSNLKQEYLDHPGFFTINVLAQFIQLKHFLGLSPIYGIDDLNSTPLLFDGISDIVTSAHFLAFSSVATLVLVIFFYCYAIFKENFSALLISLAILFADASITHYVQLRTELIASLLLFFSLFIFFRENIDKDKRVLSLYLALVVLFFSLLNKTQLILYIPFYIFWAIYTRPIQDNFTSVLFENRTQVWRAITALSLCYLFFIIRAKGPSIPFNIIYLSTLNALVFFYWKKNGGNLAKQITSFNVIYLLAYGTSVLLVFLILGYASPLFSFNSPIEMAKYMNRSLREINILFLLINSPMEMAAFVSQSLREINLLQISATSITTLVAYLFIPAREILLQTNSSSFLFFLNLILLFFLKNKVYVKLNVMICLIIFYLTSIITSFRYLANHYVIFSEFFLIMALIKQISVLKYKKILCLFVFFVLFFLNIDSIKSQILNDSNDFKNLCNKNNNYMSHWHRQLDIDKFTKECSDYEKQKVE